MNVSRTFIQVMAIALTLEAAFFLAKSNLGLKAETIVKLSVASPDAGSEVMKQLVQQNVDTKMGMIFLIGSFAFLLWDILRPSYLADAGNADLRGMVFALALAIVLLFAGLMASHRLAESQFMKVQKIAQEATKAKHEQGISP